MSRRPKPTSTLQVRAGWRLAPHLLFVCFVGACSVVPLPPSADRGPRSFLGVKFGSSFSEAQKLHPLGSAEISPYGSEAYRLSDVVAGVARYESVIYEFTPSHGMQMVLARFSPDSRDQIFQELHKALGNPDASTGASSVEASSDTWMTGDGASVKLDGPRHQLVLVGPYGKSLEVDVSLRDQLQNY